MFCDKAQCDSLPQEVWMSTYWLIILFAACGEKELCSAEFDSDEDGLDDCLEAELGTNPEIQDSDGDGYSESQVLELFRFLPQLELDKLRPPLF